LAVLGRTVTSSLADKTVCAYDRLVKHSAGTANAAAAKRRRDTRVCFNMDLSSDGFK
jgi:hypothetical protein